MALRRIVVGLVVSVVLSVMVVSSSSAAPADREAALRAKGEALYGALAAHGDALRGSVGGDLRALIGA
jgi:hypothetical protein